MQDLKTALPHLLMAALVIVAVSVLAILHILTGGEALPVIGAAGGFTLGGTIGSASASTASSGVAAQSASTLAPPNHQPSPTPATTPATPPAPAGT